MRQRLLLILGLLVWINVIVFGITEQKDADDGRQVVPVEHSEKRHFERPAFDALLIGNIRTNPIQGTTARHQEKQQQTTFTSVFSSGFRLFYKNALHCKYILHLQIIPNFPSIDIGYPFDVFW